jgi:hypothetical protein
VPVCNRYAKRQQLSLPGVEQLCCANPPFSHFVNKCRNDGDVATFHAAEDQGGTAPVVKPFLRHDLACGGMRMSKRLIVPLFIAVVGLSGVSGCTDPYDPGQRAVGGGLIGAGAGAALGAIAGGGHGAAIGAIAGGAVGAVTGAATTPPRY